MQPYRVLDLGGTWGCFCSRVLSDLGADVLVVEPPWGDRLRRTGPFQGEGPGPETSVFWHALRASQRSITLDIETTDGCEILVELARRAHFLVEAYPPGYLESLGLGFKELLRYNPRLVVTSISPFGGDGPYSAHPACDLVVQALSGLAYISGDAPPPLGVAGWQSYVHAGFQAAAGTMLAHYHRLCTGQGQHVDVSAQACLLQVLGPTLEVFQLSGLVRQRLGQSDGAQAPSEARTFDFNTYRCLDGYCTVSLVNLSGEVLAALVNWLATDPGVPRLPDRDWSELPFVKLSGADKQALRQAVACFADHRRKYELFEEGCARGVPVGPVNVAEDIMDWPQFQARGFLRHLYDDPAGAPYPRLPFLAQGLDTGPEARAPLLGEHNRDVYVEELGLTERQLQALKLAGAL